MRDVFFDIFRPSKQPPYVDAPLYYSDSPADMSGHYVPVDVVAELIVRIEFLEAEVERLKK